MTFIALSAAFSRGNCTAAALRAAGEVLSGCQADAYGGSCGWVSRSR